MMPGDCAFCGAPDNVHRVLDAIVGRVIAGDPILETVDDYGNYSAREVWLMTTAVLSERLGNTRSKQKQERIDKEWRAFNEREGQNYWELPRSDEGN